MACVEWQHCATFVSGMMFDSRNLYRLEDSFNFSAKLYGARLILQLINVLAALVEFRMMRGSVLLHQTVVMYCQHVTMIGIVGSTAAAFREFEFTRTEWCNSPDSESAADYCVACTMELSDSCIVPLV